MSRAAAEGSALQRRQHAAVFAALGDETRLSLVNTLADGEARSIAQLTGGSRLTRQAITKHLRVLEEAGIVHSSRHGRQSLFELDPAPMSDLRGYLERVAAQWDEVLGRLRAFVEG
jgi:DNA-binding transcriptional ArsR family regulator